MIQYCTCRNHRRESGSHFFRAFAKKILESTVKWDYQVVTDTVARCDSPPQGLVLHLHCNSAHHDDIVHRLDYSLHLHSPNNQSPRMNQPHRPKGSAISRLFRCSKPRSTPTDRNILLGYCERTRKDFARTQSPRKRSDFP
jgi:hypothetical protein